MESRKHKILWVFIKNTDHSMEEIRPDMVIKDTIKELYEIIDFAIQYSDKLKANAERH